MQAPSPAKEKASRPLTIGFFVLPDFSLMALSSAIEPLRAANRLMETPSYDWKIISLQGGAIHSSNKLSVESIAASDAGALDRIFVVASLHIEVADDTRYSHALQFFARHGVKVGAISNGSFLLARAGLLNGYRCTLHWESIDEFNERFPEIETCREIYVEDRGRMTCAGGVAAIDMILVQIADDVGADLATNVADQFLHSRIRGAEELQRREVRDRFQNIDPRLATAVGLMETHIEDTLSMDSIVAASDVSHRQLERLFKQAFGIPPRRYYLDLRLNEARRLLRESRDPIGVIALRCGFLSTSHLGSAYRQKYGRTPTQERRKE